MSDSNLQGGLFTRKPQGPEDRTVFNTVFWGTVGLGFGGLPGGFLGALFGGVGSFMMELGGALENTAKELGGTDKIKVFTVNVSRYPNAKKLLDKIAYSQCPFKMSEDGEKVEFQTTEGYLRSLLWNAKGKAASELGYSMSMSGRVYLGKSYFDEYSYTVTGDSFKLEKNLLENIGLENVQYDDPTGNITIPLNVNNAAKLVHAALDYQNELNPVIKQYRFDVAGLENARGLFETMAFKQQPSDSTFELDEDSGIVSFPSKTAYFERLLEYASNALVHDNQLPSYKKFVWRECSPSKVCADYFQLMPPTSATQDYCDYANEALGLMGITDKATIDPKGHYVRFPLSEENVHKILAFAIRGAQYEHQMAHRMREPAFAAF